MKVNNKIINLTGLKSEGGMTTSALRSSAKIKADK